MMISLLKLANSASIKNIIVFTLDPSVDYEPYERTRTFYDFFGLTLRKINLVDVDEQNGYIFS